MKIVVPKKPSRKVEDSYAIVEIARELQEYLESGDFKMGPRDKTSVALHHSQVEAEDPLNFFVIKREIVGAKNNEIVAIINPEIIEKDLDSITTSVEGCISFQFRPDKKVKRYNRIKVRYDVPDTIGSFETKEEWVEGFKAMIFQHECQHAKGHHIYQ